MEQSKNCCTDNFPKAQNANVERRIPTWEHVPTCRRSAVSTTITRITQRDSCLHLRDDKVSVWAFHNVSADRAERVYKKKERKKKTAHKQQPTHRLRKTPTQHLILFTLSKFWSCISLERNRTLLLFLDTLLVLRVSPLWSFYYKTKLSAGNRWSGETEGLKRENTEEDTQTCDCRAESRAAPHQQNTFHMITATIANSGSWNSRLIMIPWWQIPKEDAYSYFQLDPLTQHNDLNAQNKARWRINGDCLVDLRWQKMPTHWNHLVPPKFL